MGDLVEVNEAFAPVPLAVAKVHFGGSLDKINVNGGAMSLGHPLGSTGTKLMATLVHELDRRKGKYGLLSICEGGGTANATIIERIDRSTLWATSRTCQNFLPPPRLASMFW